MIQDILLMKHIDLFVIRIVLFLGLLFGVVALGQESGGDGSADAPPPAPPAPATPEPTPIEQTIITRTLSNGLTVKKQAIPGVDEAVIFIQINAGDDYDPADGPGLSQLLIDLAAFGSLDNDESSLPTPELLDKKYPLGWVAHSHPEFAVLAFVVPAEQLDEQLGVVAKRITKVPFTKQAVDDAIGRMRADLDRRFRKEVQLIPMSWVTAKAFRHVSHPHYGISPDKLAKLSLERLRKEWLVRTDPRNITLFLCGNLGEDESGLDDVVNTNFSTIKRDEGNRVELTRTVHREEGSDRRRRIIVDKLPGDKESVVVAFYAPGMTDADHPAFLAVADDFMKTARKMPGAQARIPFQYSLLLDHRAAYLTPHIWRFPKGAGQALGFWTIKILNRKFSNSDGRSTLHRLAWQLGSPLSPSLLQAINKQPALLYTIAYASALRERIGDSHFWESYRNKLKVLRKDDLAAARDEYFTDKNEAIFVLTPRDR